MKITIETEGTDRPLALSSASANATLSALDGGGSPLEVRSRGAGEGEVGHPAHSTSQGLDGGPVAEWLVQAIEGGVTG
jgi:hypothetical protein